MWWLRRTVLASVIAALAVLVIPAPAMAAKPKPPPVTPVSDSPSAYAAATAGSLGTIPKFTEWAAARAGNRTIAGFSIATPAAQFIRGAGANAGGPLTGAFSLGFGLGAGGLQGYVLATGDNPLENVCGTGLLEAVSSAMYVGISPDCSPAARAANEDVTVGEAATFPSGASFKRSLLYPLTFCGPTVQLAAGWWYRMVTTNGAGGLPFQTAAGWRNTICPPSNSYGGGTSTTDTVLRFELINPQGQVVETALLLNSVADPERSMECTVSWSDGTTSSGGSITYKESGGIPMGRIVDRCKQAYVDGAGRSATGVSISSDGTPIHEVPFTSPSGGDLELYRDGASCMTWDADCVGWWDATDQGTNPGPYSCTFAGEPVDLLECSVYKYTFDNRDGGCPTITEPDGEEPEAWFCEPDPNSTSPDSVVRPGEDCYDSWSDEPTPIDWVIKPIQCGFVSLFVPSPEVVKTAFDSAIGKWENTMPGQVSGIVETTFTVPAGGSGCQGPQVLIPLSSMDQGWVDIDFYPLAACSSPMSDVAAWSRILSAAVLVYATAVGVVRRISSVVNAPGIN